MQGSKVLSGRLDFLNLPELLQLLGNTGSHGTLYLRARHREATAEVYFHGGNPVNARNGALAGLEALQSLFAWREGEFEFRRGKVEMEHLINRNVMEIILDGLRMIDDGELSAPEAALQQRVPGAGDEVPLIKRPIVYYFSIAGEESYTRGTRIIGEGQFGSWIWIVLRGEAQVSKETVRGPVPLFRVGEGGFVGSLAAIFTRGTQRHATVTALSECVQLGVLDSQTLYSEFSTLSTELRELILSLDRRFVEVSRSVARTYSGQGRALPQGYRLALSEGAREQRIFQIVRGDALIARRAGQSWVPLARLGVKDCFGALPLAAMGHEPQSAAVWASPDLRVKTLDGNALEEELRQTSNALRALLDYCITAVAICTVAACRLWERSVSKDTGDGRQNLGSL